MILLQIRLNIIKIITPYALDFPEQIEAYQNIMQIDSIVTSSYADGYLGGLLQIKEYMKQYEERIPDDKLSDFQNKYLGIHSLEKRLQSVIKQVIC